MLFHVVVAFFFFIILVIIIVNNKYLPLMCGTEFLAQLLIKNIKQTKVINKNFNYYNALVRLENSTQGSNFTSYF